MKFEFNYDSYKKILRTMKETGTIYCFDKISKNVKTGFILRHDVDFDIKKAHEMAMVEETLNVKSSFFIMTTSNYYNLNSNENKLLIKDMIKRGFEIGLHFDPSIYDLKDLKMELENEIAILENITKKKIISISLHNPSIHNTFPTFNSYINAYSKEFFKPDLYLSDSSKNFRDKKIYDFIKKGEHQLVQILFHPIHFSEFEKTYSEAFSDMFKIKINELDLLMRTNLAFVTEIGDHDLFESIVLGEVNGQEAKYLYT